MISIHVSTLGRLVVRRGDRELAQLPAQRLRCAVLVYLAVERRATREQILSLLWPDRDPERARHALSQTLYELRNTLGDDWVESRGDAMYLDDPVVSDVTELEAAIEAGAWRQAVELYQGRFLDGIYLVDTREFEGWVDRLQARLARLFRQALREAVGELRAADDLEEALRLARRGVEMDPLDDEAQHQLVLLLAETGQRTSALKQYERYEELLRAELDVEPLEETVELARRIREGELDKAGGQLLQEPELREPEAREAEASDPDPMGAGAPAWELIPTRGRGTFFGRRRKEGRDARSVSLLARSTFVAIGVGVFVLVLVGVLWLGRSTSGASADSTSAPSLPPSRIAVLYFDDHSADRSLGGLADGITETLIHELAQVPGLDVVPRNGSKLFRDRDVVPWDSLVSVLRAGTIVEGSVDQSEETARVTVQLVDAATQASVESTVIELPIDHWFALHDSIGSRVASMVQERVGLEVRLSELRAGTEDEDAFQLAQTAEFERNTAETLKAEGALSEAEAALLRADALLAQAARQDPDWVQPPLLRGWTDILHAELEESRIYESGGNNTRLAPHLNDARRHAEAALEIDPENPEALELAGVAAFEAWRTGLAGNNAQSVLETAERNLRGAFGRDPSRAHARGTLSSLLWRTGRFEEAYIQAREAHRRDRFLDNLDDVLFVLGQTSLDLGRPEEAAEWITQARERFPGDPRFPAAELALLALTELWTPDVQRAWNLNLEFERLSPPHLRSTNGAYGRMEVAAVLARASRRDSAIAVLTHVGTEELPEPTRAGVVYLEAYVWLLLGETDSALTRLDTFLESAPQQRVYVREDWLWEPLWNDPEFQEMVDG